MGQDPKPEAAEEVEVQPVTPARTPTRPTSGSGASTPTSTSSPSCRRWRERLWFPLLGERAGAAVTTHRHPFDLLAPLPTGPTTTVLEASAGTGKTYALAALVTRYVAEGTALLDDMLLITFSRAASQELRERVRDQLVRAAEALDDPAHRPTTSCSPTWSPAPTTSWPPGAATCATRWPASTPRPSRPPTSSASWCCARSASPATPTPGVTLVENLDELRGRDRRRPLPPALRRREGHPRADPRPGARAGARGRAQPAHPAHADRPAGRDESRRTPRVRRRRPRASSSGASGCSASSASTTCCPGSRSRSRPTTRRPATG